MRKPAVLFFSLLLVVMAGQAGAKTIDWHGTLELELGTLGSVIVAGSGVATINNSTGGTHINMLRLAGGITGTGVIPVTDPETTGTIPSIHVSATMGFGTLSRISHTVGSAHFISTHNRLPIRGFTRVCLLTTACTAFLPLNHTTNNGATGIGVGGLLTVGGKGSVRISIVNAPWTLGQASGTLQTHEGAFITRARKGFIHGPASNNSSSSAGKNSGVVQLIASQQVTTSGIAGNSTKMTLFATLTLHFIPEPGLFLLISSGVVGLGLLGRSRMKK